MYLNEVVLPLPLFQTFSYLSDVFLIPGIRVIVPFRNLKLVGIIKDCHEITEEDIKTSKIEYKKIEEVLDSEPIINYNLFPFLEWVSQYYLAPLGLVYKIALPSGVFNLPQKRIYLTQEGKEAIKKGYLPEIFSIIKRKGYHLKRFLKKANLSQKEILNYKDKGWIEIRYEFSQVKIPTEIFVKINPDLKDNKEIYKNEILVYLKEKGDIPEKILKKLFPKKEVNKLLKKGWLIKVEFPKMRRIILSFPIPEKYELTPYQKEVFKNIKVLLERGKFQPILLFGITGSGKSFIYLEAIKEILKKGKRVLVLVPEIALTNYMEMLLLNYFKRDIALLHSGLSPGERFNEWKRILKGEAQIVVGTRSAIFAPIDNLGLIVVDEEHDPSYKEEKLACKYHARDLALIRGKMENIPVILGSATPSIKSFYWAKKGKYHLFTLKERPYTTLPDIKLIENKKFSLISDKLKEEIEKILSEKKSVFLYLNRRGYAPLVRCEECHYIWSCPNCGIPLTYHKEDNKLLCHYCNFELNVFTVCPHCGGTKVKFQRAGTEKVEEEIRKLFPEVEIVRLDRDSVSTEKKLLQVLEKIYKEGAKIIVGTQMGVHGHNFPEVNLVGILRAEEGLLIPFYKAGERSFQLLIQAAGRAGRKKEKGKVIFQTFLVEHYVIKYALEQDYEGFYEEEIKLRKKFSFPPFCRLATIRIEGIKEEKVKEKSLEAKQILEEIILEENIKKVKILGPAPCPFRKLRGLYRWHFILKAYNYKDLNRILKKFLVSFKVAGLKIFFDIDPEELL
ncbi:replication restart helicase PriA [Thermodesulfobacterium hydrogeniphilum]|uniref:replication restart helicase PriA n=1 Tax=Thermodesulfobacterium hydrogeniphilum TaxID=161156 RepID=UPI00056DA944|nr:primosomal protein N' [Thermodesulfobacterium hydrogeniphilum]